MSHGHQTVKRRALDESMSAVIRLEREITNCYAVARGLDCNLMGWQINLRNLHIVIMIYNANGGNRPMKTSGHEQRCRHENKIRVWLDRIVVAEAA